MSSTLFPSTEKENPRRVCAPAASWGPQRRELAVFAAEPSAARGGDATREWIRVFFLLEGPIFQCEIRLAACNGWKNECSLAQSLSKMVSSLFGKGIVPSWVPLQVLLVGRQAVLTFTLTGGLFKGSSGFKPSALG